MTCQAIARARTLIKDRPFALLDEPSSALDAGRRADLQDLAAALLKEKNKVFGHPRSRRGGLARSCDRRFSR